MIHFVTMDLEGYPTGGGTNKTLSEGSIALPNGITAETAMDMRFVAGEGVQRPSLLEPTVGVYAGTGRAITFASLPTNTFAEIDDALVGYRMATLPEINGVIEIELPDSGLYRIEVTPPRPWLPMTLQIEVP